MKIKYIAELCETARLEFNEKQFNNLQEKTVKLGSKNVICKAIIIENPIRKFDYFIMFPVNQFKKEIL